MQAGSFVFDGGHHAFHIPGAHIQGALVTRVLIPAVLIINQLKMQTSEQVF